MGVYLFPLAIALLVYRRFDHREPRRWFQFPWWAPLVGAFALQVFAFLIVGLAGGDSSINLSETAYEWIGAGIIGAATGAAFGLGHRIRRRTSVPVSPSPHQEDVQREEKPPVSDPVSADSTPAIGPNPTKADSSPRNSGLGKIAGVVGTLVGIAVGRYAGVTLLIPLGLAWIGAKLGKRHAIEEARPFIPAFAAQFGQAAWFTLGLLINWRLTWNALDPPFLCLGLAWLLARPGFGPVALLGGYHLLGLAMNMSSIMAADIGTPEHKALTVHLVFRLASIGLMTSGLVTWHRARRDRLASGATSVEASLPLAPTASAPGLQVPAPKRIPWYDVPVGWRAILLVAGALALVAYAGKAYVDSAARLPKADDGAATEASALEPTGKTLPIRSVPSVPPLIEITRRASSGDAEAEEELGDAYYKGAGVPADTVTALGWYLKAAEQGRFAAQFRLGLAYAAGRGVPRDQKQAEAWLEKAAGHGFAPAQYLVGEFYYYGWGVDQDPTRATEYYRRAAEQGEADAQVRLATLYAAGQGVEQDLSKAAEWSRKAADQGNAKAQYQLGILYANGSGVPKDPVRAASWCQKSADQGYAEAEAMMGMRYMLGMGVVKNESKAVEWCERAAAHGDVTAQRLLAQTYSSSESLTQNQVLAYAWANIAAASDGDATLRDELEANLSPAERAEGQRLASSWKKGKRLTSSGDAAGDEVDDAEASDGSPSMQATGTAFVVSGEGHLLTNYHVIAGGTEIRVAGYDGVARVITFDKTNDLALLQLSSKTKEFASLCPAPGNLHEGDDVVVFGYPLHSVLSSGGNTTSGSISALTGLGNNTTQLQITAPIQPGSSGSPVLDRRGDLVGIVSSKLDDTEMAKATGQIGQNVNFAINGQTVRAFLDATHVPYRTGSRWWVPKKSNVEVAQEARKWTVLVETWK